MAAAASRTAGLMLATALPAPSLSPCHRFDDRRGRPNAAYRRRTAEAASHACGEIPSTRQTRQAHVLYFADPPIGYRSATARNSSARVAMLTFLIVRSQSVAPQSPTNRHMISHAGAIAAVLLRVIERHVGVADDL